MYVYVESIVFVNIFEFHLLVEIFVFKFFELKLNWFRGNAWLPVFESVSHLETIPIHVDEIWYVGTGTFRWSCYAHFSHCNLKGIVFQKQLNKMLDPNLSRTDLTILIQGWDIRSLAPLAFPEIFGPETVKCVKIFYSFILHIK